jgi:hypothetical protein
LVARDGAIDWLCWPHFDSELALPPCSATSAMGAGGLPLETGRIAASRRYRGNTLILETRHETAAGVELGLPILLAARFDIRTVGLPERRL